MHTAKADFFLQPLAAAAAAAALEAAAAVVTIVVVAPSSEMASSLSERHTWPTSGTATSALLSSTTCAGFGG